MSRKVAVLYILSIVLMIVSTCLYVYGGNYTAASIYFFLACHWTVMFSSSYYTKKMMDYRAFSQEEDERE